MDAAMVNPFIEGTLYILDTTASVKAMAGTCYVKTDTLTPGDISAVLSITGDLTGSACLCFTEKSILGIVSAMFGEPMTRMDEEIVDAVGEIGNMVSGHVTTKMTEMGKNVGVKLQAVKTGREHGAAHAGRVLVLPFKTTKGDLFIEVCFQGAAV